MRIRICAAILASVCLFTCRLPEPASRTQRIDLIDRLRYAEKIPDTQVILFGTAEAKPYLLSGWSSPEKQSGETFQWALAREATLHFRTMKKEPLYLHLRVGSFYENAAEVLVNRQPVGTLRIPKDPDDFRLEIPESVLANETNVLEFRFAELRTPPGDKDRRELAASFYRAVITPSKFAGKISRDDFQSGLWKTDTFLLSTKKRRAIAARTGLLVYYTEKLSRDARLRFGTYFRPSPVSDVHDAALFRVFFRDEAGKEEKIFESRMTESGFRQMEIPLASFVSRPGNIYEILLEVDRNSIFDAGETAWIDPVLEMTPPPEVKVAAEPVEQLRRANRGANVVFIIQDAGGAKHYGSYGYFRPTTPVFDALAKEGIRLKKGYTQAVYTLASTASLMSGLDPLHHRIITRKSRLPAETITLAERFAAGGYSTGTFVANGNASGIFGMTQGFQEIGEVFRDPNYSGWAKDVTDRFSGWLDRNPRKPFFAYLHFREPHGPFNPPPEWKFKFTDPAYNGIAAQEDIRRAINFGEIDYVQADKDYITALYDANLNYGDHELGRVLQKLKDLGIYDNTIVIVTADHGEAFWEHNFQGHNSQLYEESVHIPVAMKLTARSGMTGQTIDGFVRTIDFYPTLIDLMGLSRRDMHVDGRSILPYLAGAPDDGRPVYSQTIMEQVYMYREGDYKYIIRISNHAEELYNLKSDPLERTNLVATAPVPVRYFRSRIAGWLSDSSRRAAFQRSEKAVLDDNTKENLRALGYIDE